MTILVEVADLVKRYADGDRSVRAVDGVTLSVRQGELVVLRGTSGSGKTTLLGLLGGMIAPSSGDVRFMGESIVHLREHHRAELRRTKVGFVFQELALVPEMSVLENVMLPLVPDGGGGREDEARALDSLGALGITRDMALARASHLSGGQRQRAAIVRALVRSPKLLLLDEPTAHLDRENAESIARLLVTEKERGRTIIASTHDPRLADAAGIDRTLEMRDGRLVRAEAPR